MEPLILFLGGVAISNSAREIAHLHCAQAQVSVGEITLLRNDSFGK